MALKTFVIVSGINNLSDARYCAGMLVNQLGFNIEKQHNNYTDPQSFKELSEWVSGVEFVGEFELESSAGSLKEQIAEYDLQAIMVSSVSLINEALSTGKSVIYRTDRLADAQEVSEKWGKQLDYIILEDESAGTNDLAQLATTSPIVLGSGVSVDTVEAILDDVQPKGIALKGGNEIRPGYKEFDEMADILEALEDDEWA